MYTIPLHQPVSGGSDETALGWRRYRVDNPRDDPGLVTILAGAFGLKLSDFYHLAQIALVLVALIALVYARNQVHIARNDHREALKFSGATFLLELERRWSSEELQEARSILHTIRDDLSATIGKDNPRSDDTARLAQLGKEFSRVLNKLRAEERDRYHKLMRICGFFEIVGVMVKNEHIPLSYVDQFLRGPVMILNNCFRQHIKDLQKETGMPPGLYEHALYLSDEISRDGQTA